MSEKQEQQVQTAIRLPEVLLVRVDELAVRMSQPGMRVTRAEVLRLAAFKGVELLEGDHPKQPETKKTKKR
jgi:hypothetical protein